MQTNAHQTGWAHCDGAPVHYARHRPEQTTLYRLVQQHAATFFAQTEETTGADLPQFVKDEFDDRDALEQLCRTITRTALANERVQINAAGQVVLKLKTQFQ